MNIFLPLILAAKWRIRGGWLIGKLQDWGVLDSDNLLGRLLWAVAIGTAIWWQTDLSWWWGVPLIGLGYLGAVPGFRARWGLPEWAWHFPRGLLVTLPSAILLGLLTGFDWGLVIFGLSGLSMGVIYGLLRPRYAEEGEALFGGVVGTALLAI